MLKKQLLLFCPYINVFVLPFLPILSIFPLLSLPPLSPFHPLSPSCSPLSLLSPRGGPSPPPLCGATPASSDYVAKQGDKVAARVKAVDGDEQWILAEVVSYSHSTYK